MLLVFDVGGVCVASIVVRVLLSPSGLLFLGFVVFFLATFFAAAFLLTFFLAVFFLAPAFFTLPVFGRVCLEPPVRVVLVAAVPFVVLLFSPDVGLSFFTSSPWCVHSRLTSVANPSL